MSAGFMHYGSFYGHYLHIHVNTISHVLVMALTHILHFIINGNNILVFSPSLTLSLIFN